MVACLAVALAVPVWQLALAVALAVFLVAERGWPPGWTRGSVPAAPTAVAAAVTPFALVGWFLAFSPDLSDVLETYVPAVPPAVLVAGAIGFVAVNATLEELVWRGVFQSELEGAVGRAAAVWVQAASFGLAHAQGFPRGVVGVLLAGGWAVLLGWLRQRSGGLLAPVLAHLVADAVIAAIVLTWVAR
ncbi:MAG: CPBP family intramembrane metalloprotease [Alphaproteobacteria bacterium]|nr:CPBP family intramembrane metalloprotease [Alphaproteobacteria bacterium]